MRGCFRVSDQVRHPDRVLPAYAGMFPRRRRHLHLLHCSPRVCGDVSQIITHLHRPPQFSPRMRGCFHDDRWRHSSFRVLPAYAGMFPCGRLRKPRGAGSPRVCGDVSVSDDYSQARAQFSPRMRGCFRSRLPAIDRRDVLPAYAGMFRRLIDLTNNNGGSPRVCGDVSSSILPMKWRCRFSPRMRGCFSVGLSLGDVTIVLPAYAGMFLRKPRQHRCQRGFSPRMRGCFPRVLRWGPPALSSPRVCGDVSVG